MNWREWVHDALVTGLASEVSADSVYGAGSLRQAPDSKPFVVLRFDPEFPQAVEGYFRDLAVWVHDKPGSYVRIDRILELVRSTLVGQVSQPGAVGIVWQGDGFDADDDLYGTITRNGNYRAVGRV